MNDYTKLVAVLVTSAVCSAASAAEISIYGRAHVSVDQLDDGAAYNETNFSSNSSRLGFLAQAEYGPVTALAQIEQTIDIGTSGSELATRDTFVGLAGRYGLLRLGRFDTPFKRARGPANLFGEQVGDMRNLARAGETNIPDPLDPGEEITVNSRFDERTANTVHYQSPERYGMQLNLAYSLHEGDSAAADEDQGVVSTSLRYRKGPLEAVLAWEHHNADRAGGERDGVRLVTSYQVIDALRMVAFYQQVDHSTDELDSSVAGVGGEYTLNPQVALRAMYLARQAEPDDSDAQMLALGAEYRIDRALRVYLAYAAVSNDEQSALTPWRQGRSIDVTGVPGETASALSLGLRFDF